MGIRFNCDSCQRKLNVKAFLAGKRGICPHCGARVLVPTESQIASSQDEQPAQPEAEIVVDLSSVAVEQESSASQRETADKIDSIQPLGEPRVSAADTSSATDVVSTASSSSPAVGQQSPSSATVEPEQETAPDPIDSAPDAKWYVRPPSGGQYGPAEGSILRKWIAEGRVSADSLVWREGWVDWRPAGPEFSALSPRAPAPPEPSLAEATTPDIPIVESATSRAANHDPSRRKSSVVGIAIVVILGMMVLLLSVLLLVIMLRQDDNSGGSSTRIPGSGVTRTQFVRHVPVTRCGAQAGISPLDNRCAI